jgi:hypothetical protein
VRVGAADSGGAIGQQDGDAVDNGIAAATPGAAHCVRVRREGLPADGADEPAEVFGLEGHGDKVLGSRFEVRGKATTEILTLRVRMTTCGMRTTTVGGVMKTVGGCWFEVQVTMGAG